MAVTGVEGGYAYQKSAYAGTKKTDGADFMENLKQAAEQAQSSKSGALTREKMRQMLRDKIEEMNEKLQKGEVEQSFQIGSQSFTLREWDKFLEQFGEMEDAIREMIEQEIEKRKEEAEKEEAEKTDLEFA